jgi:ribosomal protein S12
VVNTASQPIFTYYTKKGTQLSTTGGTPATTFRNCTKTVKIHLVVMADPRRPDSAINLVTHVDLRNSNEVTNCP